MAVTFVNVKTGPASLRLMICALLWALAAVAAAADARDPATTRIIVKWRDTAATPAHVTPARLRAVSERSGRRLARGWNLGGSLSVVQLPEPLSGRDLDTALAQLRADPEIELAVADERVRAHAYAPNDPLYPSEQWYMQDFWPAAIRANEAWEITRGGSSPADSTVVVAVLDSGIRPDHPDLAGKLLPGWDFVSTAEVGNDGDGWDPDPTDPGDYITADDLKNPDFADNQCGGGPNFDQPLESSWHGTRVAGLIAAASDNGVGITGAGFHVKVLPVRVLGKCGGYISDVIAGMYWAAGLSPPPPVLQSPLPPRNTRPARIINMSLGTDRPCTDEASEMYRVAVRQVTASGALIVASAGNSGAAVGTPASCDGVLAVAGIRHVGTKVGYSNLGPQVSISAPAGNCINVDDNDPCLYALNTLTNLGTTDPEAEGYSSRLVQPTIGTSFAAPLVAGTAALMLTVNPDLSPRQVIDLVRSSARPFPTVSDTQPQPPACQSPDVNPLQEFECFCSTLYCGAGMLDAGAAVAAAVAAVPVDPPATAPAPGGGGGDTPLALLLPGLLILLRMRAARTRTSLF